MPAYVVSMLLLCSSSPLSAFIPLEEEGRREEEEAGALMHLHGGEGEEEGGEGSFLFHTHLSLTRTSCRACCQKA